MEEKIKCPKCGSEQITADKKGFSGGKALAGAVLTGGVGLLAGTIGSNKILLTCLSCGHQFKPGEAQDAIKLKKQQEKEAQAKAMKSPAFWVFFIVIMALFFWLFKGCF